jgi:hypothetical protein
MTDAELIEKIREFAQKNFDGANSLLEYNEVEWFTDMYRDSDGVPNSYGNFDDCMDDGQTIGENMATYEICQAILKMIEERN